MDYEVPQTHSSEFQQLHINQGAKWLDLGMQIKNKWMDFSISKNIISITQKLSCKQYGL
jgi:hypothetical protein